jgi:hypothetical protein
LENIIKAIVATSIGDLSQQSKVSGHYIEMVTTIACKFDCNEAGYDIFCDFALDFLDDLRDLLRDNSAQTIITMRAFFIEKIKENFLGFAVFMAFFCDGIIENSPSCFVTKVGDNRMYFEWKKMTGMKECKFQEFFPKLFVNCFMDPERTMSSQERIVMLRPFALEILGALKID